MNCPVCSLDLMQSFGRSKSTILIVGEVPGEEELRRGVPFSGASGEVLQQELARTGMQFSAMRATYLWLHPIPKGKGTEAIKAQCYEFCYGQLIEQMSTARAVLLIGADLAPIFTGHKVTKIQGVPIQSRLVPSNVEVLMAMMSPGIALTSGGVIGDIRHALEQFAIYTKSIYKEMLHAG